MTEQRGREVKRTSLTFATRVQNKLISQFAKKGNRKKLLSDEVATIVDDLYYLLKVYSKDRSFSEATVTSAVKMGLQIKMLVRNDLWNKNELAGLDTFAQKLASFLKRVVWYSEEYQLYDREVLLEGLMMTEEMIKAVFQHNLSKNALSEMEKVAAVLRKPEFLDTAFSPASAENRYMKNIGKTIKTALVSGGLMTEEECME